MSGPGAATTSRRAGARRRPASADDEFVGVPEGVVRRAARRRLRRAALARRVGWRHVDRRAGRALPGAGGGRRAAPGARLRVDPPRRLDPAHRRHRARSASATCPPSSTARSGARASPSPKPAPTSRPRRPRARREGDRYVVNGQKVWASGALHADWCLLLARTDRDAPKRKGISYFLMDMRSPGIDVRPIRQATGESPLLRDVPQRRGGPRRQPGRRRGRRAGRSPRQTLGGRAGHDDARAGRTAGQRRVPLARRRLCATRASRRRPTDRRPGGAGPPGRAGDRGHRRCGGCAATLVERHERGAVGPADASIVKLFYSELLQRLTDFAVEVGRPRRHRPCCTSRVSSGWESGAWVLDFISSWEWTIPGGSSEIQRTIIGERGLGLPREPAVGE